MSSLQIFISWSGDPSREVAETLASFVQHVLRGAETFVSTQDIAAGDRWEARLSAELERTHQAILCVTKDNQVSPWLNYEAGALGKVLGWSRVIPYTIGFRPSEMSAGPLSRFQGVQNDMAGTWSLVRSLNRALARPSDEAFVREDFELWWPRLQEKMTQAFAGVARDNPPSDRELLLEMRRDMQRVMAHVIGQPSVRTHVAATVDPGEHDELTGLVTRRAFVQRAEDLALQRSDFVVAVVDLDNLKAINDTWGHGTGDAVIKEVASALLNQLLLADTIGRIGGDEFVALFREQTAMAVIESIMHFIESLPAHMEKAGLPPVTASAGVSTAAMTAVENKLREADRAMYNAKKNGKRAARISSGPLS